MLTQREIGRSVQETPLLCRDIKAGEADWEAPFREEVRGLRVREEGGLLHLTESEASALLSRLLISNFLFHSLLAMSYCQERNLRRTRLKGSPGFPNA